MNYVIKADIPDPRAATFTFAAHKTMYGGRRIAPGDTAYLFASETQGGRGLIARGTVTAATPTPPTPGSDRQTPRVSVSIARTALARHPLGRRDLKLHADWQDGRPETELNFKFYRQATNKICGISDGTAAFLETFF
jgi:hypothetical protein